MGIYMGAIKGGTRRNHSDAFKAQVIAECAQLGKSVSGVALAHGINSNLLSAWLRKSESAPVRQINRDASLAGAPNLASEQFVSVHVAAPIAQRSSPTRPSAIQLELRRGNATVNVTWPSELASECGSWLREWLR